jgi:exodeoxyribonuclease VII small subunit
LQAPAQSANVLPPTGKTREYAMPTKKSINLEKALSELEKLVEEMEQGNLSLEESLKRFEKGIALTSECQETLQKAELKVQELMEKNGKLLEKNFIVDE